MLAKLLSMLATAKGAGVAVVIVAAAAGTTVAVTNPDVQNAVQNVTVASASPSAKASACADSTGKPAVVAARNDYDSKIRDAFQEDQKNLEQLHSTKVDGADRQKLEDLVKDADAKLRARYQQALNDVAALTLGRNGQENKASTTATATASASAGTCDEHGARPTLGVDAIAKISSIVTTAVDDMSKIVSDATTAVGALPATNLGKPSGNPGQQNRPSPTPHP